MKTTLKKFLAVLVAVVMVVGMAVPFTVRAAGTGSVSAWQDPLDSGPVGKPNWPRGLSNVVYGVDIYVTGGSDTIFTINVSPNVIANGKLVLYRRHGSHTFTNITIEFRNASGIIDHVTQNFGNRSDLYLISNSVTTEPIPNDPDPFTLRVEFRGHDNELYDYWVENSDGRESFTIYDLRIPTTDGPTRDGYTFAGWVTEGILPLYVTENKTEIIHAAWEEVVPPKEIDIEVWLVKFSTPTGMFGVFLPKTFIREAPNIGEIIDRLPTRARVARLEWPIPRYNIIWTYDTCEEEEPVWDTVLNRNFSWDDKIVTAKVHTIVISAELGDRILPECECECAAREEFDEVERVVFANYYNLQNLQRGSLPTTGVRNGFNWRISWTYERTEDLQEPCPETTPEPSHKVRVFYGYEDCDCDCGTEIRVYVTTSHYLVTYTAEWERGNPVVPPGGGETEPGPGGGTGPEEPEPTPEPQPSPDPIPVVEVLEEVEEDDNDEYYYVEEEEQPLAYFYVEDPEVPLAAFEEDEEIFEIVEAAVPLGDMPQTGAGNWSWMLTGLVSSAFMATVATLAIRKSKKEDTAA